MYCALFTFSVRKDNPADLIIGAISWMLYCKRVRWTRYRGDFLYVADYIAAKAGGQESGPSSGPAEGESAGKRRS